jgi:hypothetical protein
MLGSRELTYPAKLKDVHQQPTPLEGNLEGNSPGILKVVLIPQEVMPQFESAPGHHKNNIIQ